MNLKNQTNNKMKTLVERIRNRELAIENNGILEELRKVLEYCFPSDTVVPSGLGKYFLAVTNYKDTWMTSESTYIDTVSVKEVLAEIEGEGKESFHTGEFVEDKKESEMTHEEAIKELAKYQKAWNTNEKIPLKEAINYAINQLKQCEVFYEPFEMVFSNSERFHFYQESKALLTLNNQYLVNVGQNAFKFFNYARPIKKEPLTEEEWFDDKYPNGVSLNNGIDYKGIKEDYTEYLKKFKDK